MWVFIGVQDVPGMLIGRAHRGKVERRDGKPMGLIGACQSNCLLVLLCCSKSEGLFGNEVGTVQRLGDSHAFRVWNVAWVKKKGKE